MGSKMIGNCLGHVGMGTGTFKPFDQIFEASLKVSPDDILAGKVDGLVIWGGADISPTIYGEPVGPQTGAGAELSHRDKIEVAAVEAAIKMGLPLIGVCRGAQLLCAMAGGKLVQDVQNHMGDHHVTTSDGRSIVTSSIHHQMMYPFLLDEDDYDLLAWADRARSHTYEGVDVGRMTTYGKIIEPEVVYFHKINGLAIQGHPEFMNPKEEFVQYVMDLAREYLK